MCVCVCDHASDHAINATHNSRLFCPPPPIRTRHFHCSWKLFYGEGSGKAGVGNKGGAIALHRAMIAEFEDAGGMAALAKLAENADGFEAALDLFQIAIKAASFPGAPDDKAM